MEGLAEGTRAADGAYRRHRQTERRALLDARPCCPNCGCAIEPPQERLVKRGAVTVERQPNKVTWNGRVVPLSPCEIEIFLCAFLRGRSSFATIERAMIDFGCSPDTRAVLIWRIRRKFAALGAANPFENVGLDGVRYVPEPDRRGSTATIIGLDAEGARPQPAAALACHDTNDRDIAINDPRAA